MKSQQIALLLVVIGSVYVTSALEITSNVNQCTRGPAHWCENLANAKNCSAVRHCIQTVWEKQDVPEDNDSICNICLDMVKQARDQLESNETQNDLKAVFEGSCRLILLKPIQKECIKLADNFIPELIEALASQMNPQVVCSVAGLCNNAKIDKMLMDSISVSTSIPELTPTPTPDNYKRRALSCEECGYVSSIISTKFKITSRDDMLESVLSLCGHFGSFSDACGNIALTYFKTLYEYLSNNFDANAICHISGTCVAKYHQHPEVVEIQNWSSVGVLSSKDDIPCELCQQLVHHLQEVLTANTTELEFKQVLEGLCKQTKGFKVECLSIVDQYYDQIYQMLVSNLDANGACFLIGVCPKGSAGGFLDKRDLMPLIPYIEPAKINVKISKLDKSTLPVYTREEINSMQLPIDLLTVQKIPTSVTGNAELCTLCEYFLHFLQETLATPATDEKIKDAVVHLCDKFPTSLRGNCHNFVEMYGDAVIALMIQGFDPRQMCPKMDLCPKNSGIEDVAIISPQTNGKTDKSTCPMCLLGVQQAQELIRDNKSKKNIRAVLDNLCNHLSGNMKNECVDFVETYSNELVDMLITDFTPQQICVYIKLCTSDIKSSDWANIDDEELIDDLFSKEDSSSEIEEENILSPECLLCEKVISEAEKKIGPAKSKDAIEKELYKACSKLKKLADKCHTYIDKYGDKIADLILQEMTPKQICKELGYCSWKNTHSDGFQEQISVEITSRPQENRKVDSSPCVFCELVIKKLEDQLKDKKTEEEIKHEVENICKIMPKSFVAGCDQFIEKYGDLIIALVQTVPPKEICQNLELCPKKSDKLSTADTPPCMLCEVIINQLEKQLKDNETADEIKHVVENICSIMPQSIADECDQFIEKYGNLIISLLQTLPPKQICENLLMCSKQSVDKIKAVEPTPCVLCEFITKELQNQLKDKKTTEDIKHVIENICKIMPKSLTNSCDRFIEQYGNLIIELAKTVTPKEICQNLDLCPGIQSQLNDQVVDCGICHGATIRLVTYINEKEETLIKSQTMIETVCNDLPAKYYKKCSELLKYYGKSIRNLINRKTEQSKICANIGKCSHDENSDLSYVRIL